MDVGSVSDERQRAARSPHRLVGEPGDHLFGFLTDRHVDPEGAAPLPPVLPASLDGLTAIDERAGDPTDAPSGV